MQVGILQKMQHCRNTVPLLGCYETNDEVMVVTGLCSGGDLQKLSDVSPVSGDCSSNSSWLGRLWGRLDCGTALQQLCNVGLAVAQ
jgi:serine/threonine protein kinase